jgi:hypothetical protein
MSREEAYKEAMRYIDNGRDNLKKAGKADNYYKDIKYVKTGCGVAYNGVLFALDYYLDSKGVKPLKHPKKKSIEWYRENIARLDKKLLSALNDVYTVLHIDGYYEGIKSVKIVQAGFEVAEDIIDRIKPAVK